MPDTGLGPKLGVVAAAVVGIFILAGLFYKSSTNPPPSPAMPLNIPVKATGVAADDPNINLQCLVDHVQQAPAPFHLSYKKATQATSSDWETDITPNAINGTIVDGTGTQAIHGDRANGASWGKAVAQVTTPIAGSRSTFALVRNTSATTRAGKDTVNGQSTIEYTIDTGRDTAVDAAAINSLLGSGGFIKGTAWVTKDGCPVKFVLDAEMHMPDGSVEKEHYEEAVTATQNNQ
jgi:hypothetical protein